jgi:hypothetical protein
LRGVNGHIYFASVRTWHDCFDRCVLVVYF